MAVIAFISLYDRNANGLRLMSAALRNNGYHCHLIFLKRHETRETSTITVDPGESPWIGVGKNGKPFKYACKSPITSVELDLLCKCLAGIRPSVIGVSVTTPLRSQAADVTRHLKKVFTAPIIWGGFDATVNPASCLEFCDYVCIGEGDQAILDVARAMDEGKPLEGVNNLAYLKQGELVRNPLSPLEMELDRYPWRDNSSDNKYLIEDNELDRGHRRLNDKPYGVYQAMTARGCPYRCSYCCEASFKDLYHGQRFLRRRSAADMIGELLDVKKAMSLTMIHFEDEIFAIDRKWLEEFIPLYCKEISLPFTAYIYPTSNIDAILPMLRSAGLANCCLALESGSVRINREVFRRVYNRDLFLKTAQLCKALDIDFYTDVITYNPYEEEQDLRDTLEVLEDIGGGFDMCINKLFVLPGTELAGKMNAHGIHGVPSDKARMFDYYCRLFWITSFTRYSKGIIAAIERLRVFRTFPCLLNPLYIEAVMSPVSFSKSVVRSSLPTPVHQALQVAKSTARAFFTRSR